MKLSRHCYEKQYCWRWDAGNPKSFDLLKILAKVLKTR